DPILDQNGNIDFDAFESVFHFPELIGAQNEFTFTYLHPGDYFLTIVADTNEDGTVSEGDHTHVSETLNIAPKENAQVTVSDISIQL
ncbi:MAG: hypothetical protein AAF570_24760, partial [Bacteroidota bacterium]